MPERPWKKQIHDMPLTDWPITQSYVATERSIFQKCVQMTNTSTCLVLVWQEEDTTWNVRFLQQALTMIRYRRPLPTREGKRSRVRSFQVIHQQWTTWERVRLLQGATVLMSWGDYKRKLWTATMTSSLRYTPTWIKWSLTDGSRHVGGLIKKYK